MGEVKIQLSSFDNTQNSAHLSYPERHSAHSLRFTTGKYKENRGHDCRRRKRRE